MISGSEDCLFLNVYTRELPDNSKQLKPVMFWVHGGGFTMGSGSPLVYGPEFLLTKDIVLVTVNYRVGLLGFLNLEDSTLAVPGNMGLKDQVLALQWVRDNIKQFNGDTNNVTIFGVSAGAASVHCLLLSPLAKGLFHKCIMQSGCALAWWAKGHRSLPYVTKALGINTTNEKDLLKVLEDMSATELIEMQQKIPDEFEQRIRRSFGPVVEHNSPTSFLSEEPESIIKSGNYSKVPIMIGFTSREGMICDIYCTEVKQYGHTIQNFESKIPFGMKVKEDTNMSKIIANKIKKFYYGEQKTSEDNKNQYYLMHGDFGFIWPTFTAIKQHSDTSKTPIYLYKMSADSNLNLLKRMLKIDSPGVAHGDDIGYLFKNILSPEIIPNSVEEVMMKACVTLWTNFAMYGDPNSPQKDSLMNVQWKPVDGDTLHYLDIGENLTTGVNPEENRIEFWKELIAFSKNKL